MSRAQTSDLRRRGLLSMPSEYVRWRQLATLPVRSRHHSKKLARSDVSSRDLTTLDIVRTDQTEMERARYLIRALMQARGLTWGAFGRQERTAQRFLDGENISSASLAKIRQALGLNPLTFVFLGEDPARAADLPNEEDVLRLIRALITPAAPDRRTATRRAATRNRAAG